MADKYLLEDGSGGYLLEDGSGYYLLEPDVAGGFRSPVLLWPYGFGAVASTGPFTLAQSGAIAVSGALSEIGRASCRERVSSPV